LLIVALTVMVRPAHPDRTARLLPVAPEMERPSSFHR
jgi:hypothetical protein